jgi:hypothetical protein
MDVDILHVESGLVQLHIIVVSDLRAWFERMCGQGGGPL